MFVAAVKPWWTFPGKQGLIYKDLKGGILSYVLSCLLERRYAIVSLIMAIFQGQHKAQQHISA